MNNKCLAFPKFFQFSFPLWKFIYIFFSFFFSREKHRKELLLMICGSTLTTTPTATPTNVRLFFFSFRNDYAIVKGEGDGGGSFSPTSNTLNPQPRFSRKIGEESKSKNDYCYIMFYALPENYAVLLLLFISNHILIFLLSAITHSQTPPITTHRQPSHHFILFLLWRLHKPQC